MEYISQPQDIHNAIFRYKEAKILWLDTEVADYKTRNPLLSLISILDDPTDIEGEQVCILDILDYPYLVEEFINEIMLNSQIEKVFHNAKYDSKFLGKKRIKNITCTLEMAKEIPYYILATPNFSLKTLTEKLCDFGTINKSLQTSNWKQRPLTKEQLNYAAMDVVYLAQIHNRLLQFKTIANPSPETENISALTLRYRQIEHRWKQLDSEMEHIKNRLKKAMESQEISEAQGFKLSSQTRTTKKTSFLNLAQLVSRENLDFDFNLNLTKPMQKQLENHLEKLSIEEEISSFLQLKIKDFDENDLPF